MFTPGSDPDVVAVVEDETADEFIVEEANARGEGIEAAGNDRGTAALLAVAAADVYPEILPES